MRGHFAAYLKALAGTCGWPGALGSLTKILTPAMIAALLGVTAAQALDPSPELAARAERFAEQFLAGDFPAVQATLSAEMQAALPDEVKAQVRSALLAENGELKQVGAAGFEDRTDDYLRYRVPVTFASGIQDLRIVFDKDGLVAGFFREPHNNPNAIEGSIEAGPKPEIEGHWEGSIEIPGLSLAIKVDLAFAGGHWTGGIDIPMQGAKGLPLTMIRLAGGEIAFSIAGVPGEPTFSGKLAEGKIAGDFVQSGQTFPFSLGREAVAGASRPQEPKPPYPYREVALSYPNRDVTLAATLTLPEGAGPFPAALLLTGSGPQNRDEEIFGHKPFLVLADYLTRAGIAVLRADDRGVGGSTGDLSLATQADLAADALAGLGLLRARPEIDPARVGFIGHSEGALIAPKAAVDSGEAAFVILLAGPGVSSDTLMVRQLELLLRAAGLSEASIDSVCIEQRRLLDLVRADGADDAIAAQLGRLMERQRAAGGVEGKLSDEDLRQALHGPLGVLSPWFRDFVKLDPRIALRKLRVPVLALNGGLDMQVDPKQNLPEIKKALAEAGNDDVSIQEMEGLNHLFQQAQSGSVDEYYRIEETMNPRVLETIRDWILARVGKP